MESHTPRDNDAKYNTGIIIYNSLGSCVDGDPNTLGAFGHRQRVFEVKVDIQQSVSLVIGPRSCNRIIYLTLDIKCRRYALHRLIGASLSGFGSLVPKLGDEGYMKRKGFFDSGVGQEFTHDRFQSTAR